MTTAMDTAAHRRRAGPTQLPGSIGSVNMRMSTPTPSTKPSLQLSPLQGGEAMAFCRPLLRVYRRLAVQGLAPVYPDRLRAYRRLAVQASAPVRTAMHSHCRYLGMTKPSDRRTTVQALEVAL
jgi:hypothetical protein